MVRGLQSQDLRFELEIECIPETDEMWEWTPAPVNLLNDNLRLKKKCYL